MRKIIIKFWFGIYRINLFGKLIEVDRAFISNVILLLIPFYAVLCMDDSWLKAFMILLPFLSLVFNTFIYLQKKPVKWNELSEFQKWYYGEYWVNVVGHKMDHPREMKDHYSEWIKLTKKYDKN